MVIATLVVSAVLVVREVIETVTVTDEVRRVERLALVLVGNSSMPGKHRLEGAQLSPRGVKTISSPAEFGSSRNQQPSSSWAEVGEKAKAMNVPSTSSPRGSRNHNEKSTEKSILMAI